MAPIIKGNQLPVFANQKVQAIEIADSKAPGQTGTYRCAPIPELIGKLGTCTAPELFESGLAQSRDRPCLGHREVISTEPLKYSDEYTWQTYAEVDRRRRALGTALENIFRSGRFPAGAEFEGVGILSVNRPEWQIIDLACMAYNKVSVALYETLGPNAVEYVINHSDLPMVFTGAKHIDQLLKTASNCPSLKMIVSMDPLDATIKTGFSEAASELGIEIREMRELEAEGRKKLMDPIKPSLDTLAVICYTSGTTNNPKGAMITHGCLTAGIINQIHSIPSSLPHNYIAISYLPLAHIFGRVIEGVTLATGGCIGYYTGSPANLMADMQILKPHFFPSVPRVLNRIYASAMAHAAAPGIKGALFRRAVAAKIHYLRTDGSVKHALWDALIFKKVQAVLGGRISWMASGSAPISADTMDFLRIAFACDVQEGYGLTETMASSTRTLTDDPRASGTIGPPLPRNEIKLVDAPELQYFSTDKPNPRGELCVRGDNVFSGYYKDEKNTREAIDDDGWFHTGDVAEVDQEGRFKIIDRVKNVMKLSQGEYVALEKITSVYSTCGVVAQIYVHGESVQDHLVAVVVPDPAALAKLSEGVGYKFDPTAAPALAAAIKEPRVSKAVLDAMTAHAKAVGGLRGFEIVKKIHLTLTQFTVENNTMTPTFKIRRKDAYNMYKEPIDSMYGKQVTA